MFGQENNGTCALLNQVNIHEITGIAAANLLRNEIENSAPGFFSTLNSQGYNSYCTDLSVERIEKLLNLENSFPTIRRGLNSSAVLSADGTLVHLIGVHDILSKKYSTLSGPTIPTFKCNNSCPMSKKMLSTSVADSYTLSTKVNNLKFENTLLKDELQKKDELLMEICNSKPFANFISYGLLAVILGFVSLLLSPFIGMFLFLSGFCGIFMGFYAIWRTKEIAIINPNTMLLGLAGSVFLIFTMTLGFILY